MNTDQSELVAMLREIRDALRELPEAIATALATAEHRDRGPRRLAQTDRANLAALLPVIWTAVGRRTFSVHELIQHAALEVKPAIALRGALAAIGSTRTIGRLLSRANDVEIGGYRIVAIGRSREGMLLSIITETRKTLPGG